ncbi:translation initiation factor IF-6 [Candidatus Woesearchaeota archaeon]|nr:translation initiation factor IF-6 [Candidatus Woesearchaeota archaeon]
MQIAKLSLERNPNIGLYGFATDKYCLLGKDFNKKEIDEIQKTLNVPIVQADIYNSSLIGVFCNGNEEVLFIPEVARKTEIEFLKTQMKKLNVQVIILKTKYNALGNNLIIYGKKCLYSPLMKDIADEIKKCGFKIEETKFNEHLSIGSCAAINKHGILLYNNADEKDLKKISSFFNLKVEIGSINFGSPYVRSGTLVNSNGAVVGTHTTGYEIMRLTSALGFENN